MEKPTTKLSAQDRVILFCVATGIDHGSVHIIDHAMQSMAIRGFIAHNRESGAYTLTDSGRATQASQFYRRSGLIDRTGFAGAQ